MKITAKRRNKKLPLKRQKVEYKPSSVLRWISIWAFFLAIFIFEAEIAPSCKFKLAANRGLPCLKSRDFSGELLPRRCTITVSYHFGSCGHFGSVRLSRLTASIVLRRHSMVSHVVSSSTLATLVLHTVFFFSVALSSPSRTLGFPKQICYLGCPDFPHLLQAQAVAKLARQRGMVLWLYTFAFVFAC